MKKKRFHEWGFSVGNFARGKRNNLCDVPGVLVGYKTLSRKNGQMTGVTAILPSKTIHTEQYFAGMHSFNGAGELTGALQIQEWGYLETPILLTNTHGIGPAHAGCVQWMLAKNKKLGRASTTVLPVISECDDSGISDGRNFFVRSQDALDAIESASTKVLEGNVGGGTGLLSCGYKSGTGSASRNIQVNGRNYTLGILLQSNWGLPQQLRVLGFSIEKLNLMSAHRIPTPIQEGSLVGILATDAPLSPGQLERLAKRCALGIARCGSSARHGSGEIFVAFSTAERHAARPKNQAVLQLDETFLNLFFEAATDVSEEAFYNSLIMSDACVSWSGQAISALSGQKLFEALVEAGEVPRNKNAFPAHQRARPKNPSKK